MQYLCHCHLFLDFYWFIVCFWSILVVMPRQRLYSAESLILLLVKVRWAVKHYLGILPILCFLPKIGGEISG